MDYTLKGWKTILGGLLILAGASARALINGTVDAMDLTLFGEGLALIGIRFAIKDAASK